MDKAYQIQEIAEKVENANLLLSTLRLRKLSKAEVEAVKELILQCQSIFEEFCEDTWGHP